MPIIIGILTPKGLTEAPYQTQATTFAEAAAHEPDGIYTVLRTYMRDRALLFDSHLDRLEKSALLEWIPLRLKRPAIRAAIRSLIATAGYSDSRIRITIPRDEPDHVYITLTPFEDVAPKHRAHGVIMHTLQISRINPSSKTTDWLTIRAEAQNLLPQDSYEGLLINEDHEITEGFSSNFYAVIYERLHTAARNILKGISRRIVLQVAPDVLPIELRSVSLDDLPNISEAFISSSSRGIVPVQQIDDMVLGPPGQFTKEIAQRYNQWVIDHLEPI